MFVLTIVALAATNLVALVADGKQVRKRKSALNHPIPIDQIPNDAEKIKSLERRIAQLEQDVQNLSNRIYNAEQRI